MDGQSATAARERRDAHARRQVRHAAGHWLSDENVPPANKHRVRQCCVFLLVLVATSSIRRGTTRPRPRGQETVSRSVCLAPLLVILSSSRLHDSPVNGHADPCICPIARTSDVCPGNCPLRGSENASGVCAPRDGLNRENDTFGVCVCYLLDSKCFVLNIGGFLDERLY